MRCLILTVVVCAATVTAMAFSPVGAPYYPPGGPAYAGPAYPAPVVPIPGRSSGGGSHYGQGYTGGSSGGGGSGFHGQGSNTFYDQGHDHSRTRQIFENENSSSHNVGGGHQGSSSGGSGGRYNTYDTGYVDSGNTYRDYMPGGYF